MKGIESYQDRQPDLADLCLVRMSELYPKHSVITVDAADFGSTAGTRAKSYR
ncbi:MAG: hypothetical protein H0X34_05825 [Chthoniobacterales bacterium]|nr:hypothetical protein [Chthoniobacterales bacterium]